MIFSISLRRKIAIVLLVIWVNNLLAPGIAYALTSGPTQPETQSFQPAGVSDMVDLSTGDFKYNIPLLDIDGYPLNLNYESGVGMDDEASWVGLGWNLNVGAINRQLRGIPDDYSGDKVAVEQYTKPKVTVGGKLTGKIEVRGKGGLRGPSGSLSIGVFNDNYTGIGAEIGANAGMSFSLANSGMLTAGMGLGVTSNTASGVDLSPYVSLSLSAKTSEKTTTSIGGSASLGYNSRAGLKELTLGSSFGIKGTDKWKIPVPTPVGIIVFSGGKGDGSLNFSGGGSSISYNTEPISPTIQYPYKSTYGSFSVDVGGVAWIVFGGGGGTGYKSVREVAAKQVKTNNYGFLYAEKGKNDKNATMDFVREKDNPIIPEIPNLALPVHTPDLFSYTSQGGSGQFRLYRGGTGAFFDNEMDDESYISTAGGDAGFGAYAHGGFTKFDQVTTNVTRQWRNSDNAYLNKGDFQSLSYSNPGKEHVYFRQVGEKNLEDMDMSNQLQGTKPLAVNILGIKSKAGFRNNPNSFKSTIPVNSAIAKNGRQLKRTVISYLTAAEAALAGFDKGIEKYPFNLPSYTGEQLKANDKPAFENRVDATTRKSHHISEISVTNDDGKRMIYGIPVYNTSQEEYSFAVGKHNTVIEGTGNLVAVQYNGNEINNKQGIDHYYRKESKPGYATSFLLSSMLSADYVDRTGNGISDDDLGTGLKFKYSKIDNYQWRAPFNGATLNKGLLADPDDDKASIVYGKKELWYSHSISSKNKIAFFITEDRQDGQGVNSWKGGLGASSVKQKCLKEIRLYNRKDMSKPIKVVKFEYSYELCTGVPNSVNPESPSNPNGKLTLKKVYFEYGNTKKGSNHPYLFTYKSTAGDTYKYMATDRWGTFKGNSQNQNAPFDLKNDEFPYTVQDKPQAAANASLWHLTKIDLPTGGTITVDYESDDYAFVQNKRAMVMSPVSSLIVNEQGSTVYTNPFGISGPVNLITAKGLKIKVETAPGSTEDHTRWFKNSYLNGSNYLYTKMRVKISTPNSKSKGADYEFVPVYCKVKKVKVDNGYANVIFEDVKEAGLSMNPIAHASWQRLKLEYPRYAYPGFDTRVSDNSVGKAVKAAVSAIFNAARNLSELKENFYKKAHRKGYASIVQLDKSFVRLVKQDGMKIGGGVRVQKIHIKDNWAAMSGIDNTDASYGQAYEYTTSYGSKTISSGVAAYEPSVGGDENPLKQPVTYVQKIKGGINNFFELEEPFGESFYPGPSIIYSKVTVRDLDKSGEPDAQKRTGSIVNEYYTARDFPVRVTVLPIDPYEYRPKSSYSMFSSSSIHQLCFSQGYSIELNDMHGKAKATRVLNQSGAEISSTVYEYNVEDPKAIEKRLKNRVQVIDESGMVEQDKVIGREIEFFTDFRQQESNTSGQTINLGVDVVPGIFAVPIPIPHFPYKENSDYKLFRSVSAVKVVQYYGILEKVTKTENGSSISTENVAYDGLTGEALITKTQNEFKQDIYSVNLPAYWAYKGMGAAYKNLGIVLQDLKADANGISGTHPYWKFLQAGDEIADVKNGGSYWVIEGGGVKRLINRSGYVYYDNIPLAKVIRSGFRNLLTSQTFSFVCMRNPIVDNAFILRSDINLADPSVALKIINASAQVFDENWASKLEKEDLYEENKEIDFRFRKLENAPELTYLCAKDMNGVNHSSSTVPPYWKNFYERAGIESNVADYNMHVSLTCLNTAMGPGTYCVVKGGKWISNAYPIGGWLRYGENRCDWGEENAVGIEEYDVVSTFTYIKSGAMNGTFPIDLAVKNYGAIEIYKNTLSELLDGPNFDPAKLNLVFSSGQFRDADDLQSYKLNNNHAPYVYRYLNLDGSEPMPCEMNSKESVINPYIAGYLGNWRPYQSKAYQESRIYASLFNSAKKSVEVKNAGYFKNFYSFWKNSGLFWIENLDATGWVTANTVTLYDKFGQELENKDALGRYSAAKFDFKGELPAAVASNAMNREIYANSFEDNLSKIERHSTEIEFLSLANLRDRIHKSATKDSAHTGNYSAKLPAGGIKIASKIHDSKHKASPYFGFTDKHEYKLLNTLGLYPNGFEPRPNTKYVFNAWVKDNHSEKKDLGLKYSVNGGSLLDFKCKAIVEGWKLIECSFTTGINNSEFNFTLKPSDGNVYIDDIRIHPYNAHMKSYAYNATTFKLMAELDENSFATFYEYDDEGSLVRVKKETERGIVTLKESRSSYKKRGI